MKSEIFKQNSSMGKVLSVLSIAVIISFSACKDDVVDIITIEQKEAINDQSLTEAYFNEAGDLSTMAFNTPTADQIKSGRTNGTISIVVDGDTRFNGAMVTLVTEPNNDPGDPRGTITIDFGTGQTDPRGVVRKGKIIINYQGFRFAVGSSTTTTFEAYSVNDVEIEGKRKITTTAFTLSPSISVTFSVIDTGGKAIFSDQTFISRTASHTHKITLGNTVGATAWKVEGTASGLTRAGYEYVSLVTRPLIFRTECAFQGFQLPAEGELLFTVSATPITLNFGDEGAQCNNVLSVAFNNQSQNITVGN